MKTIGVIGSNGYIGSALFKTISQLDKFNLINFDLVNDKNYPNFRIIDLLTIESKSIFESIKDLDYIYLLSGLTGTKESFEDALRFHQINEFAVLKILDTIKNHGLNCKIIFPSTRLVYKGKNNMLKEDSCTKPLTIYAQTKFNAERYLRLYAKNFGIKSYIFRICVPYGDITGHGYSYGTIGSFINQAKNNGSIRIFGDGKQKRTFTHIKDLINIILFPVMLKNFSEGIYNISSQDHISIKEVAEMICDQLGANIIFDPYPADLIKYESGSTVLSDEKLQNVQKYTYQFRLKKWISKIK